MLGAVETMRRGAAWRTRTAGTNNEQRSVEMSLGAADTSVCATLFAISST
jgi:hypothetical protein